MELKEAKQILKSNRYLLENTSSSIAYHISPFKFDKFKISSKSGMGTNFYGNGIYLTFDKNVIEHFLKLMKDEYDYIYVYKVEISNTANIIEESDVGEYITDDIEEIDPSEISETLKVNGIDGVEYWNEEDGNSIVIFDANKIKIVNREEYMNIKEAKELLGNNGYVLERYDLDYDSVNSSFDQERRLEKFGEYLYEVRELLVRKGFSRGKQADNYEELHDIAHRCCRLGKSIADCAKEIILKIK